VTSLADIIAQTFTGGTIAGMTPNNSFLIVKPLRLSSTYHGYHQPIMNIIGLSWLLLAYRGYYQPITVIISLSWLSSAYHRNHQPIMVTISLS
jgi:hypothetical protein